MKDCEIINWVADRLVHRYGEPEQVAFIFALRRIAKRLESLDAILEVKK